MSTRLVRVLLPALACMIASQANAQSAPDLAHGVRNDLPRPYRTERDWGELPPGTSEWAAVTAV